MSGCQGKLHKLFLMQKFKLFLIKGAISVLAFANDGRFLASAGSDRSVLIWDLAHGHLLGIFGDHTERIETLAFSRDGNILVSGR